jgi:hypothetical protein
MHGTQVLKMNSTIFVTTNSTGTSLERMLSCYKRWWTSMVSTTSDPGSSDMLPSCRWTARTIVSLLSRLLLDGRGNKAVLTLTAFSLLIAGQKAYELQEGVEIQHIRKMLWPDWKQREGRPYKSQRVLGVLHRSMEQEINRAVEGIQRERTMDRRITSIIDKALEKDGKFVAEQREVMKKAVKEYMAERKRFLKRGNGDKEEYFDWKDKYFAGKRTELFQAQPYDYEDPRVPIAAAVLYEKCWCLHDFAKKDLMDIGGPVEFAWNVMRTELQSIFAGPNPLIVAPETENDMFR